MPLDFTIALIALFVGVAVVTGALAANAFGRMAPERRRLDQLAVASTGLVVDLHPLTDAASSPLARRMSQFVPKSPRELSILRCRLTTAGYRGMDAAILFSAAKDRAAHHDGSGRAVVGGDGRNPVRGARRDGRLHYVKINHKNYAIY